MQCQVMMQPHSNAGSAVDPRLRLCRWQLGMTSRRTTLSSGSGGRSWVQVSFRRCAIVATTSTRVLLECNTAAQRISALVQARRRRRFEDAQDVKKRKAKEISQRNSKA